MPSYVLTEKCDGCKGQDKTACQYICPNDLMVLNRDIMKAHNQETDQCWECYNCVKICPQQAIEIRGYQDFAPLGANVIPMRSHRLHHVDGEVPQRRSSSASSSRSAPPSRGRSTCTPASPSPTSPKHQEHRLLQLRGPQVVAGRTREE